MKIYPGKYKNMDCYYMENEIVKIAVLPKLGSKIASLIYKPQNFEVFFQPTTGTYSLPEYGADFSKYDTSGVDEMFPTIDCCTYPYLGYLGKQLPDHGELWSIPWTVTETKDRLTTKVEGVGLSYQFSRSLTIYDNVFQLDYKVKNTGAEPLYGLWAFHGLIACDEKSQLLLPEVEQIMTVHDSEILGPKGTIHSFPTTIGQDGSSYKLDTLSPKSTGKTEKIYVTGPVKQGQGALTLNQGQLLYQLTFPVEKVPYLGVWINEGGFKGEYNCALEPSTGYYDSLDIAQKQASLQGIAPGESIEWYIKMELTPCYEGDCDSLADKR